MDLLLWKKELQRFKNGEPSRIRERFSEENCRKKEMVLVNPENLPAYVLLDGRIVLENGKWPIMLGVHVNDDEEYREIHEKIQESRRKGIAEDYAKAPIVTL